MHGTAIACYEQITVGDHRRNRIERSNTTGSVAPKDSQRNINDFLVRTHESDGVYAGSIKI